MIFEHSRFKIITGLQHLYRHNLSEFVFTHPALPDTITNVEQAMDWIFNVLYPRNKQSVATPADLPTGVDTPNVGDLPPDLNDYRIVNDDGDGKAAGYMWAQFDGDAAPAWQKVMDIDWGLNTVLQELSDKTQHLFVYKKGTTDYDLSSGLPLAGIDAGQHIYGGEAAGQNLTLHANNGDIAGNSGYIQFEDDARPYADNSFDLGTLTERWANFYSVLATIGNISVSGDQITSSTGDVDFTDENIITTGNIDGAIITGSNSLVVDNGANQLTIGVGSITDTTGAISFGDENLSTTGTLASGTHTIGTLVLAAASITDTSGTIDFDDENLTTTGLITGGSGSFGLIDVDNIRIDGNTISATDANGNVNVAANGTGVIDLQSAVTSVDQTVTGTVDITGQLDVDNLTLNGAAISSDTNVITFNSVLKPDANNTRDLGDATDRWRNIYLSNSLQDGTDTFLIGELMDLKSANFRDSARTQPVQAGDGLFWSGTEWLASIPDTEIDHATISGLTTGDAGHTQFAMLAGRAGGQTINGGTLTTQTLSLRDNAVDGNGVDIDAAALAPNADNALDLGKSALTYADLYMTGQAYGLRVRNTTDAGLAGLANATKEGQLVWTTDSDFLQVDLGGSFVKINNKGYNASHTNVELQSPIDVSASVDDARNCIWQLCDITNNEEVMGVAIQKAAGTVTINNLVALPAGNYRLIGIQVN